VRPGVRATASEPSHHVPAPEALSHLGEAPAARPHLDAVDRVGMTLPGPRLSRGLRLTLNALEDRLELQGHAIVLVVGLLPIGPRGPVHRLVRVGEVLVVTPLLRFSIISWVAFANAVTCLPFFNGLAPSAAPAAARRSPSALRWCSSHLQPVQPSVCTAVPGDGGRRVGERPRDLFAGAQTSSLSSTSMSSIGSGGGGGGTASGGGGSPGGAGNGPAAPGASSAGSRCAVRAGVPLVATSSCSWWRMSGGPLASIASAREYTTHESLAAARPSNVQWPRLAFSSDS
jgi:hypothetical protein